MFTKRHQLRSLFIILISTISQVCLADEFKITSFTTDPSDLAAIRYERKNINDESCAIIKVLTDLDGLKFESNLGIVGDIVQKTGEYWVYVSPGEKRLRILKQGYLPMNYSIPTIIKSNKVYAMVVRRKATYSATEKGSLSIVSTPPGTRVHVDGFPDLVKYTPCSFENYRVGDYKFRLTHDRYQTKDTIIQIEKDTTKDFSLTLKPLWADLILTSNIANSLFTMNGQEIGQGKELSLTGLEKSPDAGTVTITCTAPKHYGKTMEINLQPGTSNHVGFELNPITAYVSITSTPSHAEVYLDDQYQGSTPLTNKEILIGDYLLQIKKNGYMSDEKNITIRTNEHSTFHGILPSKKSIRITSQPSGAAILIDGKKIGTTPRTMTLDLRAYDIIVRENDYDDFRKTVLINENTNTIHANLERKKQKVHIQTNQEGTMVKFKEKKWRPLPLDTTLQPGNHAIALSGSDYLTIHRSFNVNKRSVYKSYRLKPKNMISAMYSQTATSEGLAMRMIFSKFSLGVQYEILQEYNTDLTIAGTEDQDFIKAYSSSLSANDVVGNNSESEDRVGQNFAISIGYTPRYPIPIDFHMGYSWKNYISFQKVYAVEEEFTSSSGYVTYQQDDLIASSVGTKLFTSLFLGAQLFVKVGENTGITIGIDYYLNTEKFAETPYAFSVGFYW